MEIFELEPKSVFGYFAEITKIPRGSGKTDAIAKYCFEFARRQGLRVRIDKGANVVIFKGGSSGYENSPPIILQGHMDMVCEKEPDCQKNMEREGVKAQTDGEYVWAEGTTLGADDAIAVAYILALLGSDLFAHPPIEALLTADEEIGLLGAKNLDASVLKGRRIINIDSEEEGIITVGCAGAVRCRGELKLQFEPVEAQIFTAFEIEISSLLGGHSGLDIGKGRKNAAKLLARLFNELRCELGVRLCAVQSGGKVNAIPKSARARVCVEKSKVARFKEIMAYFENVFKSECLPEEKEIMVRAYEISLPDKMLTACEGERAALILLLTPDGVISMETQDEEMVRTSVNMGSVSLDGGALSVGLMIRSNTASEKEMMVKRIRLLFEYMGGSIAFDADYPPWEKRESSPLRKTAQEAYEELYGTRAQIRSVHAGLECGILAEKIPDSDIISIGPCIENAHTPKERMNVGSAQRCWRYLLAVLEKLK